MYRCNACLTLVGPGKPLQTHATLRPKTYTVFGPDGVGKVQGSEIESETHVCAECKRELTAGVPLAKIRRRARLPQEPLRLNEIADIAPKAEPVI